MRFVIQPVANPRSRMIAWHRATFAQRQQRGLDHTNPGLLRSLQFFRSFYEIRDSLQSRAHFADLIFQKCSAALRLPVFLTSWSMSANRAFGTVRSPFCRQSSHIEARNRGNAETETLRRRPQKPHYPKKNRVFRAQKRFTGELTHFQNCYSSLLLPHVSCSCSPCFCHDDRTIGLPPDIRHESLGSFRTKLPLKM